MSSRRPSAISPTSRSRALETLAAVPLIAAEDTRLTKRLLDRHGVSAKLTSFHARSGAGRRAALLDHLRGGADLALVTDAGTPVVSDPGAELIADWAAEGGRVVPIPGASAVLAAVSATAVAGPAMVVRGVPAEVRPRAARAVGRDRRRSTWNRAVRSARSYGCDAAGSRGGLRRRAGRCGVSRAHQDP